MIAIRGATTAKNNTKEGIETATIELYQQILAQNNLQMSDFVSIQISSTADLTAYYPATALRLSGCTVPLFSSQEPKIKGALKKCIRFLCLVNKEIKAVHVYLNDAENLLKQG